MQIVSTKFNNYANGQVRPLSWYLSMSFDKSLDTGVKYFTLDESVLDGSDILAPESDNPIQLWDYYKYLDYTNRVKMVEWSREIEFPSSVISAMADYVFENHDDYFTPNSGSPIDSYIIPKRPLRILSGFANEKIPQFVGLTEKTPVIDDTNKIATFHALDFLSQLYTFDLIDTLSMQDVRTDEVLADIFTQFGILPSQYNLDLGSNKIKYLFFEKGTNAGTVMRYLLEAESGNLWLDEEGIIRFGKRYRATQETAYTFDESNTISIITTGDEKIINKVKIYAQIRDIQDYQNVYSKSLMDLEPFQVGASSSSIFTSNLIDPCITITTPTIGTQTGTSWFTATTASGTNVTSGVTATGVSLGTNTYKVFFANSNDFDVYIDKMELWGEPAKVVDTIEYTEIDQDSIDKYDEQILEINNPYIQSIQQCESICFAILDQLSEYAGEIEIEVKGNPALQLDDVIAIDVKTYVGDYKIVKIKNRLQDGAFTQTITARKYTNRDWFTLDLSVLDGTAVLTP